MSLSVFRVLGMSPYKNIWVLLFLTFWDEVHCEKQYDVDPIATVTQGQLRGKFGESRNGRDYLEFLGIPYASATETFKVVNDLCK